MNDHTFPLMARIIHWVIAAGVIANLWLTEPASITHENIGFVLAFAVLLRFVLIPWLGAPRLTLNPKVIQSDIKSIAKREPIHSRYTPLGGWMIWMLWLWVLATAATGYLGYEYGYDYDWAASLMAWHEILAEILPYLIVLHIVAIVFLSKWTRTKLIKRMIHR